MDIKRIAQVADIEGVLPLLQLGYAGQEWTLGQVEAVMRYKGVHLVSITEDGFVQAYLFLNVTSLRNPLGPIPAGLVTQIASLLPQHHDQKWVDEVLAPLLAQGLRKFIEDFPDRASLPLYAFLIPTLLPFWQTIFNAEIEPRSSGSSVIWLPTLKAAADKLRGY